MKRVVVIVHDGLPTYKEVVAGVAYCLADRFEEVIVLSGPYIDISQPCVYLVVGSDYILSHAEVLRRQIESAVPRRAKVALWYCERLPLPNRTSTDAEEHMASLLANRLLYDAIFVSREGNRKYLESVGIEAGYAPLGFHPVFDKGRRSLPRTIDALFLGWTSERRNNILAAVAAKSNLVAACATWGEKRDKAICSSKVFVNIHYDEDKNLEGIRFLLGMANETLIVSETVDFPEPYRPGDHFVMVEAGDLPDSVAYYVSNNAERQEIIRRASEFIRSEHTMDKSVSAILASI